MRKSFRPPPSALLPIRTELRDLILVMANIKCNKPIAAFFALAPGNLGNLRGLPRSHGKIPEKRLLHLYFELTSFNKRGKSLNQRVLHPNKLEEGASQCES